MLDTGAEVSCVNSETLNSMLHTGGNKTIKLHPTTRELRSAQHVPMQVTCDAEISFSLNGVPFTWTFAVVVGLQHQVIIGNDFITSYVKYFSIEHQTVKLKSGDSVPFYTLGAVLRESNIYSIETHVIQPRTSKFIFVCARNHLPIGNLTGIFEPNKSRANFCNAEIITLTDRLSKIYVENSNNHPITITGGSSMGQITEIREASICTFAYFLSQQENNSARTASAHASSKNASSTHTPSAHAPSAQIPPAHTSYAHTYNINENAKIPASLINQLPPGFTIESHLTPYQQRQVAELVAKYRNAFIQHHDLDHGLTHLIEHKIELTDPTPVHVRQFRLDHHRATALDEIVDKLMTKDKMEQSISPWNMPIFVIKKSDGTWRIVSDFRLLNAKTKRMEWPLPNIQETIENL